MSGIKSLRRKAKVTQGELAALIDSSGAVSHYETGRRIPDVAVGKRIVSAFKQLGLNTSLDEVFSDDVARDEA
ncbi:XRE family transcriptional regulator [Klebsiella pneumoniae]|nr:XRE family transcriptional regulator [Klebsiella pneumoniae]RRE59792.1 XRE family transcriptional regulator [Klebsiella pneumoniae]RRE78002.1 XRE family transcriptional regulator [Klebsiella pneumoniae]RRE99665.1 XRE family transcriptional regulator [Klebsiella pneumoniae]